VVLRGSWMGETSGYQGGSEGSWMGETSGYLRCMTAVLELLEIVK
jgi:hypothetical protein